MMINNLRDIESDTKHAKFTAMSIVGENIGRIIFVSVVIMFTLLQCVYVFLNIFFAKFMTIIWNVARLNKNAFRINCFLSNQGVFIVCCILLLLITYMFIKKAYSLAYAVICGNYANAFPICVSLAMLGALTFVLSIFAC